MPKARMPEVKVPSLRRVIYTGLAGISFSLGVIGLFLPLLPTTCFMLLAVGLASKGSPRFALWIRRHPRFGPPIRAWEQERAIPRHAKLVAVALLTLSMVVLALSINAVTVRIVLIVGLSMLAVWIYTRPEPLSSSSTRLPSKALTTNRPGH